MFVKYYYILLVEINFKVRLDLKDVEIDFRNLIIRCVVGERCGIRVIL